VAVTRVSAPGIPTTMIGKVSYVDRQQSNLEG
jgi:hypothetical protein